MVLIRAGPAEILRSNQKDELAVRKLQKLCEDVILSILGPRFLIKHKTAIQNIGQLLYFGNTTLCGLQTLGEEYTGILQVDDTYGSIPSLLTRFLMVLLQCYGSQLSKTFINKLEKNVKHNEDLRVEIKKRILNCIALIKIFLPSITLLHKAIFYCNVGTYHLSKRIMGVNYVLIRYWLRKKKSLFGFRLLGFITLINFFVHSCQSVSEYLRKGSESQLSDDEIETFTAPNKSSARTCVMCLNKLKYPTATMCGHVYCWSCITEWVQDQVKCPVCREPLQPSRLIPLHNYN